MYILVILLPLLSFLSISFFGRFIGREGSSVLSTSCLFSSWIISLFIFAEVCLYKAPVIMNLYNWILLDIYKINFGFFFDQLSSLMIIIILSISTLVHLYSTAYMAHDPYLTRFMAYLSLFTFFMLVLVTSSNFIQMFIGWEGVGLCSYLLINFWFTRAAANKAALKAMIMNRIADVFFIIGILLIFSTFRTTDYVIVTTLLPSILGEKIIFFNIEFNKIVVITFFLFVGAMGKSAQIGFHTWLPDAMEGPTPVSALLHAATMVTAGVFLIVRCSIFFEFSEEILFLLILFGGTTALFTGLVAIFQYDIKKIIAYSTCSQLGYMFFSCGLSNYYIAFYHLFNHAFFKALLFLSAGSVIHALFDEQDIRRMGGLAKALPFTYSCFLTGSLAIIGFPFLTGFYSKDLILELAYSRIIVDASFIYTLGLVSAALTAIYSTRLIVFVFFGNINFYHRVYTHFINNSVECEWQMFLPMSILSFASIFTGYLFSDMFLGVGTDFWGNSIFVLPEHYSPLDYEYIDPVIKNLPIILSILSISLTIAIIKYSDYNYMKKYCIGDYSHIFLIFYVLWYRVASFFYHAGFFNTIYNTMFILLYKLSYIATTKYLDKGIFEYLGPYGVYKLFYELNRFFKRIWYTFTYTIIFFILLMICILIFALTSDYLSVDSVFIQYYIGIVPIILYMVHRLFVR